MILNHGQEVCAKRFLRWWKRKNFIDEPTFEITGAAGTGKTTLVRYLIEEIGLTFKEVIFMAYVGKATLALAKQGLPAQTIHSAICDISYVTVKDSKGKPLRDPDGKKITRVVFSKKEFLPEHIRLLVVDEGRMVPEDLAEWILSYHIPVIVLGDLNQLDPVMGDPYFLNKPDARLTEIMRQAKDSPIPYLAKKVIDGRPLMVGTDGDGKINIVSEANESEVDLLGSDVIICRRNKTRISINDYIRLFLKKFDTKEPMVGDKIICRKNNWDRFNHDNVPLVNGMIGYITDIDYEHMTKYKMPFDFQPEDFDSFLGVLMDRKLFNLIGTDTSMMKTNYDIFEYGYAITCHLAQGSQYNSVIVKLENSGWQSKNSRKWLYTAVTRAIDRLTIIL
jgi:exodeoxyribonuclease-5